VIAAGSAAAAAAAAAAGRAEEVTIVVGPASPVLSQQGLRLQGAAKAGAPAAAAPSVISSLAAAPAAPKQARVGPIPCVHSPQQQGVQQQSTQLQAQQAVGERGAHTPNPAFSSPLCPGERSTWGGEQGQVFLQLEEDAAPPQPATSAAVAEAEAAAAATLAPALAAAAAAAAAVAAATAKERGFGGQMFTSMFHNPMYPEGRSSWSGERGEVLVQLEEEEEPGGGI